MSEVKNPTAHSQYQYDKWQAYRNGKLKTVDMFQLAVTYHSEIVGMCNRIGFSIIYFSDHEIFTMFSKIIQPPKK